MKIFVRMTLLGLVAGSLLGCKSDEPVRATGVETVAARVVESKQVQSPVTVKISGTLRARESVTLSAQVVGRVQQVLVHEGDAVRAGQLLLVLDDGTLKSGSEQAEAEARAAESQEAAARSNAELAASTLARYRQLQAQNGVSPQEMDEVTRKAQAAAAEVEALHAQTNAMKAQQSSARTMLGYSRIVAPFGGIITARMVDPGALASPGVPLIQMDGAGPLQLQAPVPESAISAIHVGMKVDVSAGGVPERNWPGTVSQIVPAAEPSSHSFIVKVDLPSLKELRAGMYGEAKVATGTKQAILAPRSAIVIRGSLPCAYVLDGDNTASLQYVTLGDQQGDQVEILSGLTANQPLVDSPADRDLRGKRIEARP